MANKVRYNIKNVHYAILSYDEGGAPQYANPVHIPGAVSLTLAAEGGITPFYADGIVYFSTVANNGYTGDLEIALIPEQYRIDVLGEAKDAQNGVLTENASAQVRPHALLFQFDGDEKGILHALYNVKVTRPNMDGSTTTDTREPQTETLTLSATPLENGLIKAKTGDDSGEAVRQNWFKAVWMPSAEPENP